VRLARTSAQAEEWSLVLAAAGIPHRIEAHEAGFAVLVDASGLTAALRALDGYDREAVESRAADAAAVSAGAEHGPTLAGWLAAALLVGFHLVLTSRGFGVAERWSSVGAAAAGKLIHGEPWRALTALTLHADIAHAVGNAIACVIFVGAACRWLGPGVGLALTLAAGAAGNLLAGALRGPGFVSVGASTATFGALGLLAGLQFIRRRRFPRLRSRAWISIGAGLALLAMLGVGARSDVGAHFAGLGVGVVLGAAMGRAHPHPAGAVVQVLAAILTVGALAGAWALALGTP